MMVMVMMSMCFSSLEMAFKVEWVYYGLDGADVSGGL